jgi:two-component system response regulator AgrA
MLDIIICEDNVYQRHIIEDVIKEVLTTSRLSSKIVLSTGRPVEALNYVRENKEKSFIYFFDIDLKDNIDGLLLAKEIREYDSLGYLIFITAHEELSFLTFKYKVQALDYIVKGDKKVLKDKITECINAVQKDWKKDESSKEMLSINFGNEIMNFDMNEILFFETTGVEHKLRIHTYNGQFEFYGSMKDIEISVTENYFRTHRSYLVNLSKIKSIDKADGIIYMVNEETCYVARRYLKGLMKKCSL